MFSKLLIHLRRQWTGALSLFLVLTGGVAYAANEWTGDNIVNGSLTTADYKNGDIRSADVKDFSLGNGDFLTGSVDSRAATDDSLTSADIKNFSLGNGDFLSGSVDSRAATDNSLTGTDINESSLNMPPTTTVTFAGQGNVPIADNNVFTKVTSKSLPAGSYAIAATANLQIHVGGQGTFYFDTACELRDTNGAFVGGGRDRREYASQETTTVSVSMNGGVQVPAGGGEVGLYCRYQSQAISKTADGQMMIIRVDGFS